MPRLLAEASRDPELHAIFYAQLVEPRRRVLRIALERARDRGELRADADLELAIDMLVGPIIYRFLITGGDLAPAAAQRAARARGAARGPQPTSTRPLTTPRLRLPASSSSSSSPTSSRRQPRSVRTSGSGCERRAATTIGARSARAAISS